jgi:hypothetical protein
VGKQRNIGIREGMRRRAVLLGEVVLNKQA